MRREAQLAGYDVGDPDSRIHQADGPGNEAWQRAQALSAQINSANRRN